MPVPVEAPITPALTFMFAIEVEGIRTALVEKVKWPKESAGSVETSSGGMIFTRKSAAGYSIEDIQLEMVVPADEEDTWAMDWLTTAVNPVDNQLGYADDYKKEIAILRLGPDGNPIESRTYEGAWIKDFDGSGFDALNKTEKMIRTITISVDRRIA